MSTASLIAKFARIAVERLQQLGNLVIRLEQEGHSEPLEREAQREIHTLKGEARILGLERTATLAHAVEDLLHRATRAPKLSQEAARALLEGFDWLQRSVEGATSGRETALDTREYEARIATIAAATLSRPTGPAAPSIRPSAPKAATTNDAPRGEPSVPGQSVDSQQLAELTRLLGELHGLESRWRETSRVLRRIEETVQRARGVTDRVASSAALDELRDLARGGYADTRNHAFEYQTLVERLGQLAWALRVVPVDAHLARYPRAVRDLAEALGKRVQLEVVEYGARVEKSVLDLLGDVVVHLLRNAVDHGIETAEERIAAGKDPMGRIRLAVRPIGAQVELTVTDDGRGVNVAELRQAAIDRRALSAEAASVASDQEIVELLFAPGFTTRNDVSEVSGRGVGLDTVRNRAASLGGRVSVESTLGRGTIFRLIVPTVASVSHVMVVAAGGTRIAIPTASVHSVVTFAPSEIGTAGQNAFVRIDGQAVPLLDLARSMGDTGEDSVTYGADVHVVVLTDARGLLAYRVSRLLGEQEAVQLPVGRFLEGHRFIRAVSLLEDADIALGIDPAALLGSRIQTAGLSKSTARVAPKASTRVLVVDDSELTRDVIVGFLRDAGFEIQEAVNGRDALERLASWAPDLILTDLQMPILDGFELLREVRESPRWRDLPMVVVSTLGAEADRKQAARLGADGYLLKSDLRRETLVDTVSRFVARTRGPA